MRPPSDYLGRVYSGPVPCYAFARDWLADHGLTFPQHDYGKAAHAEALRRHLAEYADRTESPLAGDVVLLTLGGNPFHIGIMASPTEFLHYDATHGVICESVRSARWRRRIAGYYRPAIRESAA
jgi:NlpC/P60 family